MDTCTRILRRNHQETVNALHRIGYNKISQEKRIQLYKRSSEGGTRLYRIKSGENLDMLIAGSRGEGVGICFDTDLDKVLIQKSVYCYDKRSDGVRGNYFAVFELDTDNVPDGYTRLRLTDPINPNYNEGLTFKSNLQASLTKRNDATYLRNDHTFSKAFSREVIWNTNGWLARNLNFSKLKRGPANPYVAQIPFTNLTLSVDDVLAFPCKCSNILCRWSERVKREKWPNGVIVQKVQDLDAFVVPVGLKGHKEEKLQWRICFTLAEMELVHSFNDNQIKVYAALKMLFKDAFQPISRKMSSYIAKNVMFWLCEKKGNDEFKEGLFGASLQEALTLLLDFIKKRNLPNYMIPERNMIQFDKISDRKYQELIKLAEILIAEGHNALYRCPDISRILANNEVEVTKILDKRELQEQVGLALFSLKPEMYVEYLKDLFEAETKEQMFIVFGKVFAKIRENDQFDFFHRITRGDVSYDNLIHSFLHD